MESCSPGNLACAVAVGGELHAASRETEHLLTLLQELEEEVFAATASAEKEEVRRAHPVECLSVLLCLSKCVRHPTGGRRGTLRHGGWPAQQGGLPEV